MEVDSRPSGPTLDLHTDAIILREGPGAVCSSYLRGSSSSLGVTSSTSGVTPTAAEPSPFVVRKSAFRAAPPLITVRPSPAMERVRARARAKEQDDLRAVAAARQRRRRRQDAEHGAAPPWSLFAAFALGAAVVATAEMVVDRGVELAALAAVVAGLRVLAAVFVGKGRASS